MPCSLCCLQESQEAAQRADVHNPDKLAAAGHTNTGQTLRQQVEALKEGADPQVGAAAVDVWVVLVLSGQSVL